MSRLTYFTVLFALMLIIWLVPLYYPVTASLIGSFPSFHLFWKILPLEAIVVWGLYAVFSVLSAVRNVKDYPESKGDLLNDIKEAKHGLSQKGFDWN